MFTIVFPNIRALPLPNNGIRSGYNHFPRHTVFVPTTRNFITPPPLPQQWNQIRFTIVFPDIRVFLPTIANLSLSRPPSKEIRSGSQWFSPTIELFPPLNHFLVYHAPLTREPGPVHSLARTLIKAKLRPDLLSSAQR